MLKRDWIGEAIQIANGKNLPVKKEHVQEVMEQNKVLALKLGQLNNLMEKVYGSVAGEIKKRKTTPNKTIRSV